MQVRKHPIRIGRDLADDYVGAEMRPYRGKTKKGKWVKGWYVYRGCVPNDTHYIYSSGFHHEVLPETVGQSIGLKDKNGKGKEIFEGDIINGNLFDRRVPTMGEVLFDQEHACYSNENLGGITPLTKIAEIEIIGNVTDNPELLK